MLERFLFRKVEIWVVLVLGILALVAAFAFGWAVLHIERGGKRFGAAAPVVTGIASAPMTLDTMIADWQDPNAALLARAQRFDGQAGFAYADPPGSGADLPYLLLNRYDGDIGRSVTELVDLSAQEVLHSWDYDAISEIWGDTPFDTRLFNMVRDHPTERFRGIHADLAPDGALVTQGMATPLLKFGLCGDLDWVEATDAYHHSIERDAAGNYWVPAHLEPYQAEGIRARRFFDDAAVQLSPEGEVLYTKSVVEMLVENDLGHLIYGMGVGHADPVHLNDIEPVDTDGEIWRQGDIFLSIRNRSMVFLYRPSTGEIPWYSIGPWLHQHDVDLIDNRRISVFDNGVGLTGRGNWEEHSRNWEMKSLNALWVVDIVSGDAERSHAQGFETLDLRTPFEGRSELLPGNRLFVEETNFGRLTIFTPDGAEDVSYVNRAESDGRIYVLNWSRIVDRETGDAVRARLEGGACDG